MLESLFNKVAGLFIKNRPQHRCFSVNIVKFLRAAFFTGHLWFLNKNTCEQFNVNQSDGNNILDFN